jgi:hypothetical protein
MLSEKLATHPLALACVSFIVTALVILPGDLAVF